MSVLAQADRSIVRDEQAPPPAEPLALASALAMLSCCCAWSDDTAQIVMVSQEKVLDSPEALVTRIIMEVWNRLLKLAFTVDPIKVHTHVNVTLNSGCVARDDFQKMAATKYERRCITWR